MVLKSKRHDNLDFHVFLEGGQWKFDEFHESLLKQVTTKMLSLEMEG